MTASAYCCLKTFHADSVIGRAFYLQEMIERMNHIFLLMNSLKMVLARWKIQWAINKIFSSLVFGFSFVNFTGCKNQFRLVTDMQEFNINLLRYNFIFSVYMVLILALLWCRLRVTNHQSCKCATNMSKEKWCLEQLLLNALQTLQARDEIQGTIFILVFL